MPLTKLFHRYYRDISTTNYTFGNTTEEEPTYALSAVSPHYDTIDIVLLHISDNLKVGRAIQHRSFSWQVRRRSDPLEGEAQCPLTDFLKRFS